MTEEPMVVSLLWIFSIYRCRTLQFTPRKTTWYI